MMPVLASAPGLLDCAFRTGSSGSGRALPATTAASSSDRTLPRPSMPRDRTNLPTSSVRRVARLGSLVGRVGASVLSERTASLVRSGPVKELKRTENLVRNAIRVVETLGTMKGAAMKVGQMLSLYEGLLPDEVGEVLRTLQGQAPRVPSEVMRYEVEEQLGAPIDELFAEFDDDAFAAASIGQVHHARLADGRAVAVKVQYPMIREVVQADLDNLRVLLKALFSMVFDADFAPLWSEMRDRLLEELDYEHEADNMRRLAELEADRPEIVIPRVIGERSTSRVLTMERVDGIDPAAACSDAFPQELKDRWGQTLFEFQMRGLYRHRELHADPNLANFAFREDGSIVVYDFGCLKRVPRALAESYAALVTAVMEDRRQAIPGVLAGLGLTRGDGSPLQLELIDPYVDLFAELLRDEPVYRFGEDERLFDRVMELGMANWRHATDLRFPQEVIFVDRSIAGHFGNLMRLRAAGPWGAIVRRYARPLLPRR